MAQHIRATTSGELLAITDIIHDNWFDRERITFDSAGGVVTIPFDRPIPEASRTAGRILGLLSRVESPSVTCLLRVHHSTALRIEDPEAVRYYDFNRITFDPEKSRVRISTGVPLTLDIEVSSLEVEVEATDEPGRTVRKWRWTPRATSGRA